MHGSTHSCCLLPVGSFVLPQAKEKEIEYTARLRLAIARERSIAEEREEELLACR